MFKKILPAYYDSIKLKLNSESEFCFLNSLDRKCLILNNWITPLLKMGRTRSFYNMFGRRRNNRGIMWGSLLGMVLSVAVYGLGGNRNKNMMRPIQNFLNNFGRGKTTLTPNIANIAGLTEFSKELIPNNNPNTNK